MLPNNNSAPPPQAGWSQPSGFSASSPPAWTPPPTSSFQQAPWAPPSFQQASWAPPGLQQASWAPPTPGFQPWPPAPGYRPPASEPAASWQPGSYRPPMNTPTVPPDSASWQPGSVRPPQPTKLEEAKVSENHMETTKTAEAKENNKGEIGMIPVILGLGLPMLLAAAGIYCTIEGKVNNDIASLFFAGIAMIGVAVVAILVACMFFSKHRTASDTCLNSLLCINTGTNCCELGCFAAAVTEME